MHSLALSFNYIYIKACRTNCNRMCLFQIKLRNRVQTNCHYIKTPYWEQNKFLYLLPFVPNSLISSSFLQHITNTYGTFHSFNQQKQYEFHIRHTLKIKIDDSKLNLGK